MKDVLIMPVPYNTDTTAEELVQDFAAQIYGEVILITGVSPGGLGAYYAEVIAKAQPKLPILAGRNTSKAEATAHAISTSSPGVGTRVLELNLSS